MKLRPYQEEDVQFLLSLEHGALFNEQRTGKTPTILSVIERKNLRKVIIVVGVSKLFDWQEEVERWTSLKGIVCHGPKRAAAREEWQQNGGVLLTSYDTLRRDAEHYKKKFDGMVLDEAHRICNRQSARSKAIRKIGRLAKHRYAITGTPTRNKPDDVWAILNFLYPQYFRSYWKFVEKHFIIWDSPWGKEVLRLKDKNDYQRMIAKIATNRKRKDVMKWLPPKEEKIVRLATPKKLKDAHAELLKYFEYEHVDAPTVLAQLTRLRQLCTCPAVLDLDLPSPKIDYIEEWLEDNGDEPLVVFSMFTSALNIIFQNLKVKAALITGEQTTAERQKAVKDFQSGRIRVLLCNIIAAGEGLTLDRGEVCIFLDRSYVPSENEQAQDRIVPTTEERKHPCTYITLVLQDTVDEQIARLIDRKEGQTRIVNYFIENFAKKC